MRLYTDKWQRKYVSFNYLYLIYLLFYFNNLYFRKSSFFVSAVQIWTTIRLLPTPTSQLKLDTWYALQRLFCVNVNRERTSDVFRNLSRGGGLQNKNSHQACLIRFIVIDTWTGAIKICIKIKNLYSLLNF